MVTRLSEDVATGTVIGGRYRVERLLGEGGFASVYFAHHVELETAVAIKRMHADHLTRDDLQNRFRIEAKTAARLESRHTVRVRDFGFDDGGAPYMVMDLVRGPTLEHVLETRGPLSEDEVAATALGVLAALAEAAEHGVIHRDIKPANIFLDEQRAQRNVIAKVSDFGIAKLIHADAQSATRTADGIMCTPQYAAPEMLRREAAPASDLYALGHVMVELLDGVAPYAGDNAIVSAAMHLNAEPVPLGHRARQSRLAPVLERALSKSVSSRYATAVQMRDAIHTLYADSGVAVSAELPRDVLADAQIGVDSTARPTANFGTAPHTPEVVDEPKGIDRGPAHLERGTRGGAGPASAVPVPAPQASAAVAPLPVPAVPRSTPAGLPPRPAPVVSATALMPADEDVPTEPLPPDPVNAAEVGLRPWDDSTTRRLLAVVGALLIAVLVWGVSAVVSGDDVPSDPMGEGGPAAGVATPAPSAGGAEPEKETVPAVPTGSPATAPTGAAAAIGAEPTGVAESGADGNGVGAATSDGTPTAAAGEDEHLGVPPSDRAETDATAAASSSGGRDRDGTAADNVSPTPEREPVRSRSADDEEDRRGSRHRASDDDEEPRDSRDREEEADRDEADSEEDEPSSPGSRLRARPPLFEP